MRFAALRAAAFADADQPRLAAHGLAVVHRALPLPPVLQRAPAVGADRRRGKLLDDVGPLLAGRLQRAPVLDGLLEFGDELRTHVHAPQLSALAVRVDRGRVAAPLGAGLAALAHAGLANFRDRSLRQGPEPGDFIEERLVQAGRLRQWFAFHAVCIT